MERLEQLDALRRVRRLIAIIAIAAFIPWLIHLIYTLPPNYDCHNWRPTWIGFDILELAGLTATTVLAFLRMRTVMVAAVSQPPAAKVVKVLWIRPSHRRRSWETT